MRIICLLTIVSAILPSLAEAGPPVPRVLILGDSIYQEPARSLAKDFQGRVDVVFMAIKPGEIRNSTTVLENLDSLMGDQAWDLVHFNVGLGDLVYRLPNASAFRVMAKEAGGVRATRPEVYEKNLQQLVTRLKASGAKLVWASTTPIRHSASNVFDKGSEIEYNAIAARVMAKHGVAVNDMYMHVKELIDMERPASHGVDPFFFDRKPIHAPIARMIATILELPAEKAQEDRPSPSP